MNIEFETSGDYDEYVTGYLAAIKNINDKNYEMLTNKNSKFWFYNFSDYLSAIGKPLQLVRDTVISDDDYTLTELQKRNWPNFIERILKVSQDGLEFTNYSITDKSENKCITYTIQHFKILKELYLSLYNTVRDNYTKHIRWRKIWISKIDNHSIRRSNSKRQNNNKRLDKGW